MNSSPTRPWVTVTQHVLEEEADCGRRARWHVYFRKPGRKLRVEPVWGGTADNAAERIQRRYPDAAIETIAETEGTDVHVRSTHTARRRKKKVRA